MPETTLLDAINYFADEDRCRDFVASQRWPGGKAICPTCGRDVCNLPTCPQGLAVQVSPRKARLLRQRRGMIEDSPIPLSKWLPSIWLITSAKNGISSYAMGTVQSASPRKAHGLFCTEYVSRCRMAMAVSWAGRWK